MRRFNDKTEWALETLDGLIAQEERRVFDKVGDVNAQTLLYAIRKDPVVVKLVNIKVRVLAHARSTQ